MRFVLRGATDHTPRQHRVLRKGEAKAVGIRDIDRTKDMDPRAILILCFAAGVVLQAIFLQRGDWNLPKLGGCVALAALIGLFPGKQEDVYDVYMHGLIAISMFCFT